MEGDEFDETDAGFQLVLCMDIDMDLDDPKYRKEPRKGKECGDSSLFWEYEVEGDCIDEVLKWKSENSLKKFKCCACRQIFEDYPRNIAFYLFKGKYKYISVCSECDKTDDWVQRYYRANISAKEHKEGVLNWQRL